MTATVQPTNAFSAKATGKVVQVLGNVVDVEFTADTLPHINDALQVHVGTAGNSAATSTSAEGIELGGTAMQSRDLVLSPDLLKQGSGRHAFLHSALFTALERASPPIVLMSIHY